LKFDFFLLTIL